MPRIMYGMPGIYNATPITLADGEGAAPALNSSGQLVVAAPTGTSANQVQGTTAHDAVDAGNPVKIGGYASTTAPTAVSAAGDRVNAWLDLNGRQVVVQSYSYLNIPAGQATTVVKSGAGVLHTIVLNSAATATNTTTVYDNTAGSGTVIARPAATTATVPTPLIYDLAFATGLTIVTATANGSDMTITFL